MEKAPENRESQRRDFLKFGAAAAAGAAVMASASAQQAAAQAPAGSTLRTVLNRGKLIVDRKSTRLNSSHRL